MLGNLCNHKCSYCFPGSNEGDHPWPNVDVAIKHMDHLFKQYEKIGKDHFELFIIGGEPTLWKELPKFISYFKSNFNTKIRISTNGTRGVDWWKTNAKYFDQVEVSVHNEFADVDHISEVCDVLYSQFTDVVANVLMDPHNFEKCKSIVEQLKKSKHPFPILAKVVHYNGQSIYKTTDLEYFNKRAKRYPEIFWVYNLPKHESIKVYAKENNKWGTVSEDYFTLHDLNHFKNWTCNIGVDHIEIFQNGQISSNCRAFIYDEDYHNLYDPNFVETFNPNIKPIVCRKDTCHCTGEIIVKKYAKV